MTRTFIAIALPDGVKDALARQIAYLRKRLPASVRWVPAESLHLTLAFLGELDDARLAEAEQATEVAAREASPFALHLTRPGSFGPARSPRVLWAGVSGAGADLAALGNAQARLAAGLELRDFPPEERPFSPHLTLARIKEPLPDEVGRGLPTLLAAVPAQHAAWKVRELCVMKSERLPAGARYTCLRTCVLRAASADA